MAGCWCLLLDDTALGTTVSATVPPPLDTASAAAAAPSSTQPSTRLPPSSCSTTTTPPRSTAASCAADLSAPTVGNMLLPAERIVVPNPDAAMRTALRDDAPGLVAFEGAPA
jgi:hypothetical protein